MSALRLAVVAPRYWPLVGQVECALAELVSAFLAQGAAPTVVTARWSNSWPAEVRHREVPVVRLPGAPRGGWSTVRYLRELGRWLRQHAAQTDAVLVATLRGEASTVLRALRRRPCPVVLRMERPGSQGDCQWQAKSHAGRRVQRRCQMAAAFVAATQWEEAELRQAGYAHQRIVRIPPGVHIPPVRTARARFQARTALGEVNHDLRAADCAPIVVCVDQLEAVADWLPLLRAWKVIAARWPSAGLWICGEGQARLAVYEWIVAQGLHRSVLLPGSFDDLEDLFQAADFFVDASVQPGLRFTTLSALAAGLPVVACATSEHRSLLAAGAEALLVPPGDSAALAAALARLLENAPFAALLGGQARRRVIRDYSLSRVAARYLELFDELTGSARGEG
jgi:glycosyltransferase involved in cell wall biosynthesis